MSSLPTYDVAIVGSGFGGSILARTLRSRGLDVALIERSTHPRFALGESSTPLAALSLERLAAKYDLPDLRWLAAYGRWQRQLPKLGHGLKRGFTFHDHRAGPPAANLRRSLLVAASPDASLADCHWLRADVDQHLVQRAREEGVDYFEATEVERVELSESHVALGLAGPTPTPANLSASRLVDATGSSGLVSELLGVAAGAALRTRSSLLYGHFRGVEATPASGSQPFPYPSERAAVHHLIAEGWIYELRFDDGTVSAGALLTDSPSLPPAEAWSQLLSRYPSLAQAFAAAEPIFPIAALPRIQRRLTSAVGHRWVALPHTFGFVDPLFSTGIAWTLRAVERLTESLVGDETATSRALERYDALLQQEIEQIDRLISGAYVAMADFELFAAYSLTYFATVSWAELRQRLIEPEEAHWEGFLGVGELNLERLFVEARQALPSDPATASPSQSQGYWRWVIEQIEEHDLLGLDRYGPDLAIPIDLEELTSRSARLGLDSATLQSRLHLLRGDG